MYSGNNVKLWFIFVAHYRLLCTQIFLSGGPFIFKGHYDNSFSIALQCKDNQLGYDIARKHKVLLH